MARSAEGWRVRPKRGVYQVRFRHQGRRFEVSTRTSDLGEATRLAPTSSPNPSKQPDPRSVPTQKRAERSTAIPHSGDRPPLLDAALADDMLSMALRGMASRAALTLIGSARELS